MRGFAKALGLVAAVALAACGDEGTPRTPRSKPSTGSGGSTTGPTSAGGGGAQNGPSGTSGTNGGTPANGASSTSAFPFIHGGATQGPALTNPLIFGTAPIGVLCERLFSRLEATGVSRGTCSSGPPNLTSFDECMRDFMVSEAIIYCWAAMCDASRNASMQHCAVERVCAANNLCDPGAPDLGGPDCDTISIWGCDIEGGTGGEPVIDANNAPVSCETIAPCQP